MIKKKILIFDKRIHKGVKGMIEKMNAKELLRESLLELAKTKPLNKITIKQICNNCSISRETFYYHFFDRYELMIWIYESHVKEIIEKGILIKPIIEVWSTSLNILKKYRYYYKKTFEDSFFVNLMLESFVNNLTYCVKSHNAHDELLDSDVQFAIRFYANGLLCMMIEWIDEGGAKENVKVISKRMCAIMPSVLMKYYIF